MQGDGVFINYEITELFTINFTLPIMLLCNQQNKYCEDTVFSIIRRKDPLMLDLIVDRQYSSITLSSIFSCLSLSSYLYRFLIILYSTFYRSLLSIYRYLLYMVILAPLSLFVVFIAPRSLIVLSSLLLIVSF